MSSFTLNLYFLTLNFFLLVSFKHLGLSNQILKVITELGFEKPSEIQAQAIPQLLDGFCDFIGLAQTGTGKTAAFGLPLLERVDPLQPTTQALILAPTRELGQQIAEQLEIFSKYLDQVNVLAVYGGASISTQIKALRKPQHVIIATPGRLLDLIQRKSINLERLKFLVLDEADEMLNMGFQEDLDKILSYTPEHKMVWLFSATMSHEISRIVKKYMDDPIEVKLNRKNEVNKNIEHQYTLVRPSDKAQALVRFLDVDPEMRGVVFCRTKRDTQELADMLIHRNYKVDALHGDLTQRQRDKVMRQFKAKDLQVLVATDIAARGIDVDDLSHVFHFALPDDMAYYTHRSGRTARAGKKGVSIAFIGSRDRFRIDWLSRQLGISFKKILIPNAQDVYNSRIEKWGQQILEKHPNGKLNPKLLDKVSDLFEDLSKSELIEKLLAYEIEKFGIGSSKDLNDSEERDRRGGQLGGRDNRDNRSYRGDRKSYKKKGSGSGKGKKYYSKKRK